MIGKGLIMEKQAEQIIVKFLDYLESKNRAKNTVKSYGVALKQFVEFLVSTSRATLDPDRLLLSVDENTVGAYLAYLKGRRYSKATITYRVVALRIFYKFFVETKQLSSNPVMAVKTPKRETKLPQFLEYEGVKKLLETPPMDNWLGARDRAILETLYGTGMMVSELVALNINDIDFLDEAIWVRDRNKKERTASISSTALEIIERYLELRKKLAESNSNFDSKVLFVNKNGGRISTRSICRKTSKYCKMAGLSSLISPRTLRSSFIVHMLRHGVASEDVQEIIGCQSPSIMRTYEKLSKPIGKGGLR